MDEPLEFTNTSDSSGVPWIDVMPLLDERDVMPGPRSLWVEITNFGDPAHRWLNVQTGEREWRAHIPYKDSNPFPRMHPCAPAGAIARWVREPRTRNYVVGILAGLLAWRIGGWL